MNWTYQNLALLCLSHHEGKRELSEDNCRSYMCRSFPTFFPILLRYNCHTSLYEFKVHSIMLWLIYYVWHDYHNKFSIHHTILYKKRKREMLFSLAMKTSRIYPLSSCPVCHTAVLAIVIRLYMTSPVLINLITGHLYLLATFIQFFTTSFCYN